MSSSYEGIYSQSDAILTTRTLFLIPYFHLSLLLEPRAVAINLVDEMP